VVAGDAGNVEKGRWNRLYTRALAPGTRAAPRPMSRPSRHSSPPLGARGRARRRLRYLRRLRELQLRDAGGFVFELYRFGERREALVRGKLDAIIATDKEIRSLESLLDPAPAGAVPELPAAERPPAKVAAFGSSR
jgi:hypothetical protein